MRQVYAKGRWIGTGADRLEMVDVSPGSTFLEKDTGDEYEFDGSCWVLKSKGPSSASGMSSNRPDATAVIEGFVYFSVDTDVMEYSDGTEWVVM